MLADVLATHVVPAVSRQRSCASCCGLRRILLVVVAADASLTLADRLRRSAGDLLSRRRFRRSSTKSRCRRRRPGSRTRPCRGSLQEVECSSIALGNVLGVRFVGGSARGWRAFGAAGGIAGPSSSVDSTSARRSFSSRSSRATLWPSIRLRDGQFAEMRIENCSDDQHQEQQGAEEQRRRGDSTAPTISALEPDRASWSKTEIASSSTPAVRIQSVLECSSRSLPLAHEFEHDDGGSRPRRTIANELLSRLEGLRSRVGGVRPGSSSIPRCRLRPAEGRSRAAASRVPGGVVAMQRVAFAKRVSRPARNGEERRTRMRPRLSAILYEVEQRCAAAAVHADAGQAAVAHHDRHSRARREP